MPENILAKIIQKKNLKNPRGGHFEYGRQGTSTTYELEKILNNN